MLFWTLRRLARFVAAIWFVASVLVLAVRVVPDAVVASAAVHDDISADPVRLDEARTGLGLGQPLIVYYRQRMIALARGDFGQGLGRSLRDDVPVAQDVARRAPLTLELVAAATLLACLVGILAGLWSAMRPGGLFDPMVDAVGFVLLASPVFVIGLVTTMIRAPAPFVSTRVDLTRHLAGLAIPALALAVAMTPLIVEGVRQSVRMAAGAVHVRTARAKGLRIAVVWTRHILRNAIGPILGRVSARLGALTGAVILIEVVTDWPGLSPSLIDAIRARDYPVVAGIILVVCALVLVLKLAVDLTRAGLDPRSVRA